MAQLTLGDVEGSELMVDCPTPLLCRAMGDAIVAILGECEMEPMRLEDG
jgi:hypothetical protein